MAFLWYPQPGFTASKDTQTPKGLIPESSAESLSRCDSRIYRICSNPVPSHQFVRPPSRSHVRNLLRSNGRSAAQNPTCTFLISFASHSTATSEAPSGRPTAAYRGSLAPQPQHAVLAAWQTADGPRRYLFLSRSAAVAIQCGSRGVVADLLARPGSAANGGHTAVQKYSCVWAPSSALNRMSAKHLIC